MEGFLNALRSIGPARLAVIAGTVLATIGFVIYLGSRMMQPPMSLLFGGLDTKESADLVGKLDGMKVPYELRGNGTQILVPDDQVLKLRLTLARDGLPTGGTLGYEIFDKTDSLGTTSFVQSINQLRALEGELARTIRSLNGVSGARVHLVLPRREVFSRETRDPSASVVLKLRSARGFDKGQVVAIQNLVAAAVPELKTSRIAIVDESGTLLTRAIDGDGPNSSFSMAEAKLGTEEKLKRAIESMLERSVGPGKVRAEVSVEIDHDRVVTNQKSYGESQPRSTQSVKEESSSAEAGSQGVTVQSNLPESRASGNGGGGGGNATSSRTEETTNFELGETLTTRTREAGGVRKVSVAILVDGTYTTAADGTKTYQPRPDEELQRFATLARGAIGFDGQRGDSVEVVNLQFAASDLGEPVPEGFSVMGLEKADLMRIAETGILAIVALLAILLVIRPVLSRFMAPPPPPPAPAAAPALPAGQAPAQLPAPGGAAGEAGAVVPAEPGAAFTEVDRMIDVARIEGQVKASSISRIGEIVQRHPDEAVSILRSWMYQDS